MIGCPRRCGTFVWVRAACLAIGCVDARDAQRSERAIKARAADLMPRPRGRNGRHISAAPQDTNHRVERTAADTTRFLSGSSSPF
jgi:hypothetical protein